MTGKIIELNDALDQEPELVNSDPYGSGLMIKVEVSDTAEYEQLLDADAYRALVSA